MGKWIRVLAWTVSCWMLAQSLYLWGGIGLTPRIGPELQAQANLESPLVATYTAIGRHLLTPLGLRERAIAHAAARFPDQIQDLDSPPQTVVVRFLSAQSAGERLDHYGAPPMFVLSLVLHLRRQRRIRSFGVRD